ncbi:MAG TPA: DUF5518 domain-containing protein [Pyrinomonadaceae bacterium]|nr:DUF5518 domain-containing protein [Pyrinomonadaceae bacterium]
MNDRTKAAAIGGVIAGVLSIIPIVSTCCFLWALGGGFLAVYMYGNKAPAPLQTGDAAKLGAMAGAIGALIYLLIQVPVMLFFGAASISQQLESSGAGGGMAAFGAGLGFFMVFVVAGIIVGFGALGGVIGAAVLGKNRPGGGANIPPPPPPPSYGGGTQPPAGGGYGSGGGGGYTGGGGGSFGAGS